ncbi:DUF2905 domain-containing protein [Phycisphaerales bacterium AB-hyl4]|uniref:DUF2905 domain-containing protein n=1 Tax=Natronomicrosphaera hydrolytica TaxID=3242702 RepID=A0ABV4UAI8_9BACT
MTTTGKILLTIGCVLIVVGGAVWLAGRLGFRGLPGDIVYEADGVRVYFPLVTCLVLSAVATLVVWLWHAWTR